MKTIMAVKAMKNMVFSAMVLLPLQANIGTLPIMDTDKTFVEEANTQESIELPPSGQPKVVLLDLEEKYCDIDCFLSQKDDTIEFMSKTFKMESSLIKESLHVVNSEGAFDELNIGLLKNKDGELKKFRSFEEGLIEYLIEYTKNNPSSVSNKRTPYTGGAEYVEDLIKYFTNIYDNVDYLTAISIGAAESGYYKVSYMLKSNNIYGGMSNSGLIKYKTIEHGVLTYIRMLEKNYYNKGLTTLESIGRVYCPTYGANGYKMASPHWINLVNAAKKKYAGTEEKIEVASLLND